MKITEIKYIVKGSLGITYHFTVIATNEGLDRALQYVENQTITSQTEKEVETVEQHLGSSAPRFIAYFMDGAKKVESVEHYSTGTVFSVTYS